MSTDLEWRGGEKNAHCRPNENEEPATWAWLVLGIIIFASGVLGISVTRSAEEASADFVGALAPDEIVFLCRNTSEGDAVVTAAIHFGEKEISEPVIAGGRSVRCKDGFVDPRDISATGGADGMLRFLPWKNGLDHEVARAASYSMME